jgi:uncharacterized protein (TIGR03067 family)
MSMRSMSLIIAVLLAISSVPAGAQDKIGDLVAEYGYDWIIGKWSATSDNGRQIEVEYKWILDKYAICVNVGIGDFKYHGLIMFVPSREEIVQIGADNIGGTWNGSWTEDSEGAVNRNHLLKTDGTAETMDMVYIRVDNNSFKIKEYLVEAGGFRASQSRGETIFKRQKEDTAQTSRKDTELDGTWVGTAEGEYGEWTFVISMGKVDVKAPESEYYSGTVTLNTGTSPKQADFKIDKCSLPEYVGETSLGIYKLEGNKLTLATTEPGIMSRPAFFDSTGGVMLFSLTKR